MSLRHIEFIHYDGLPWQKYEINLRDNGYYLRRLSKVELRQKQYLPFTAHPIGFSIVRNVLHYSGLLSDGANSSTMQAVYHQQYELLFVKGFLKKACTFGPLMLAKKSSRHKKSSSSRSSSANGALKEFAPPAYPRRRSSLPQHNQYKKNGLGDWEFELVPHSPWTMPVERRDKMAGCIKHFRLWSFDFESRPSDSAPVIICCTEEEIGKPGGDIKLVFEDCSPKCHINFFDWLLTCLLLRPEDGGILPDNTYVVILGFNSSRYDNIFLAEAYAQRKDFFKEHKVKVDYLEAASRIVQFGLTSLERNVQIFLRDVLLYFPVGSRGKLAVMAEKLKVPHLKAECSLDEMEYVANLILKASSEDEYKNDATFIKEVEYCRQDTRVLYGLARYLGNVFGAMEGPREFYLKWCPDVVPSCYGYLPWFFTLPQAAKAFLYCALPDSLKNIACSKLRGFGTILNLVHARFVKCSIYGGRTLCLTIGQIIRDLVSTDITSEYPSAMTAPMPYGEPYLASLKWINDINRLLADDNPIWRQSTIPFMHLALPFVAHIAFSKKRAPFSQRHNDSETAGAHRHDETLPFIPYRKFTDEFIRSPFKKPTAKNLGPLEWLADTNGKTYYGVYTSLDIYHMRRLGFSVSLTTSYRPIVWPQWSNSLGDVFRHLYSTKYYAKINGNPELELLSKIIMNSAIGKFAQRQNAETSFDGETFTVDESAVRFNRTMFQLNAFCMASSRLINQGHQSLICKGTHHCDYDWAPHDGTMYNIPVYADTDNLVWITHRVVEVFNAIRNEGLQPSVKLATFNTDKMQFTFSLEFENWHKTTKNGVCPRVAESVLAPYNLTPSSAIFLGKKSYIMRCDVCGEIRLKAKGHNQAGLQPSDFSRIFTQIPQLDRNFFLEQSLNGFMDAQSVTYRIFNYIYPSLSEDELYQISSGRRFTMRIRLPRSGEISVMPSSIERRYCAFIPKRQVRCVLCYFLCHE